MDPLLGQIAGQTATGLVSSLTGQNDVSGLTRSGDIADRSIIRIAPVGVNLGAILQPYNEGSLENGGTGLDIISRYIPASENSSFSTLVSDRSSINLLWPAVIAGAVVLVLFMRRRRG